MNKIVLLLALSLVALATMASAASIGVPEGVQKLGPKPVLRGHEASPSRQLKNARQLKKEGGGGTPNGGGDDSNGGDLVTAPETVPECYATDKENCCEEGKFYYCANGFACNPKNNKCGGDGPPGFDQSIALNCYNTTAEGENTNLCYEESLDFEEGECTKLNYTWGSCVPVCTNNSTAAANDPGLWSCNGACVGSQCCAEDSDGDGYSQATYCY